MRYSLFFFLMLLNSLSTQAQSKPYGPTPLDDLLQNMEGYAQMHWREPVPRDYAERLVFTACESYVPATSSWIPYSIHLFNYFSKQDLASVNCMYLDTSGHLNTFEKAHIYKYDTPGRPSEETIIHWPHTVEAEQMDSIRRHYKYKNGLLKTVHYTFFDIHENSWKALFKDSLLYDEQGRLEVRYVGMPENYEYRLRQFGRVVYFYGPQTLDSDMLEVSSDGGESWSSYLRTDYHYQDGLLMGLNRQFWEESLQSWVDVEKEEYVPGIDGRPYISRFYDYENGVAQLRMQAKNFYDYQAAEVARPVAGEDCKTHADPSCICIEVYDPVCGCDGVTYGNSCQAQCAGVLEWVEGPCQR